MKSIFYSLLLTFFLTVTTFGTQAIASPDLSNTGDLIELNQEPPPDDGDANPIGG